VELLERYIQIFENEGFPSVYEWSDKPARFIPNTHMQGKSACLSRTVQLPLIFLVKRINGYPMLT